MFTIHWKYDNMKFITTTTTIYRIMENIFSVLFKAWQLFSSSFAFSAPSPWRQWLHIKAQGPPTAACAETTVKFNIIHTTKLISHFSSLHHRHSPHTFSFKFIISPPVQTLIHTSFFSFHTLVYSSFSPESPCAEFIHHIFQDIWERAD